MTTEEKARAYDEALKVLHKYDGVHIMFTQDLKEEMFPELKESDDERIRKEITELIMQPTWKTEKEFHRRNELVAWLERQGKQEPVTIDIDKMVDDYANNNERGNEEFGKPVNCMIRAYRQGLNDAIGKVVLNPAWFEKQGEQKHGISELTKQKLNTLLNEALQKETPESWNEFLEPKFKVGDWVMTAEEFIKDYTNHCSNELVGWSDGKEVVAYHEWLTPDQALRAVEIAREETMKKASDWLRSYFDFDEGNEGWVATISQKELDETFRKAMEE